MPTACQLSTNIYAPVLFLTQSFIDLFVYEVLNDEGILSTIPPEIWPPLRWSRTCIEHQPDNMTFQKQKKEKNKRTNKFG